MATIFFLHESHNDIHGIQYNLMLPNKIIQNSKLEFVAARPT